MDVPSWLLSLGLEQYESLFRENDIHSDLLRSLTAEDLKELGITSVGHRRRLVDAINALQVGAVTSPPVVEVENRKAPGPEGARRQLTVMFCDLVGSTALSSRLDPEDLREILAAYHAAVAEVGARFGGFVAQYMGDGALVYFGYPQAHEYDAERAVRAGLALVERIGRLQSGFGALKSRVGIATGLVVVGDLIGSGQAQQRGVVGETPNLAARLQGMAPPNAVLIADSTRRLVQDLFDYRDLGMVEVKGLAEPVPAWHVLRESRIESRFEALRSSSRTPLVGRNAEIELLLQLWARSKEGEGQIVLICGEAGIGKSRLTAALQEQIGVEPHHRLRYFCSPYHQSSTLHPFIAQLEHAASFTPEDTHAAKLDKLAALLSSKSGDSEPETVALLADLLALPTEERYAPLPTDPRSKRELTLATLIKQVQRFAQQDPILLVFEDAHWIDSTSLELLERIAERVPRLRMLMVVSFRPEFTPPWTGQAQVTALNLSRLGQRDTRTLVEDMAGGKMLPPEILDRIFERTDGIPLFTEELTKTLLEGGLLREQDGRYVLASALLPLTIPSSLHDSLVARLDRLAAVKEVAQMGAAIGREFSYGMLAAVAHRTDSELRDALDQLVGAGLVFRQGVPPQASFVFKHALVQDVAYNMLLRGQRQQLHAAIGTVLEEDLSEDGATQSEGAALLAYHWVRAEDRERALRYTLEAAERARKLYARPEAISHYWQALDLLEKLPRTLERRRVHIDAVLSLVQLPGWMRDEAGKARMLQHVDEALADAAAGDLVAPMVKLQTIKGRHWEDETLLVDAIARANRLGDALTQAFAAYWYGGYLGSHAQFEKSLPHVARAIDIMGVQGARLEQGVMMAVAGRCYYARAGRLEEALSYAARAREAGDALGDARLRAWCAMEAEPYVYKGLWDEVVLVAEAALPVAWEIREWDVILWSSAWLAIAYLKLGRPADARRILDRAFREVPARAIGSFPTAYAQIALAECHLVTGDIGQALGAARLALASSDGSRLRLEEGAAHRVLGQVYKAKGTRPEAEAAFRRSLEVLDDIQSPPELAQTLLAYGQFRLSDNAPEGRALIERALGLFEDMNATGWIGVARVALSDGRA
jgi:class 3 adenylate cyclase/tetratricopeptide (TPR) repeat protein